jgi:hypothetical protein
MSISAQTKPQVVGTRGGTLFSDFVIGGCLGSLLGVLLGAFFPEFPGLIGVPCVVIGALIGTVVNRVRHNVDLGAPLDEETEISLLSKDDYVLLHAAASFARNHPYSLSRWDYLQRRRTLTFEEVFSQ